MSPYLLVYYILLALLFSLALAYMVRALAIGGGGVYPPFVPIIGGPKRIMLAKAGEILEKSGQSLAVVDPGSGIGSLLIPLAKRFPRHRFVGIEWSWPHYFARFFGRKLGNLELVHRDIFAGSFADADVVLCYMTKKFAPKFSRKLLREAREGCLVLSAYDELPGLPLKEKIECRHFGPVKSIVWIYRMPKPASPVLASSAPRIS